MNLGQAVAVCLYELVRGQKKTSAKIFAGKKEKTRPTSGDVERLTQALLEVLRASGYVKPRTVAAEERSRRLFRRMELSAQRCRSLAGNAAPDRVETGCGRITTIATAASKLR